MFDWLLIICKIYFFFPCLEENEHSYMNSGICIYRGELMLQNWPFDTWHAIMSVLSGNKMYCESDLLARYSSWMEYLKDFLRIGWTNGILCILYRLSWSDLLTRGRVVWHAECLTSWMFEFHELVHIANVFTISLGRAKLGCETSSVSS